MQISVPIHHKTRQEVLRKIEKKYCAFSGSPSILSKRLAPFLLQSGGGFLVGLAVIGFGRISSQSFLFFCFFVFYTVLVGMETVAGCFSGSQKNVLDFVRIAAETPFLPIDRANRRRDQ